jgi:hypothetical protein
MNTVPVIRLCGKKQNASAAEMFIDGAGPTNQ